MIEAPLGDKTHDRDTRSLSIQISELERLAQKPGLAGSQLAVADANANRRRPRASA